ncbi:MAG: TPM domain-containing protein [Coriobacteriia bacterium]|nr:TPM domain-containing protein [Coriobacteriia bacterium]
MGTTRTPVGQQHKKYLEEFRRSDRLCMHLHICKVLSTFIILLFLCTPCLALASPLAGISQDVGNAQMQAGFQPVERVLPLMVDNAGLLSDSEVKALIELFDRLSEENFCEIAVVTVDGLEGKSAMDYADDFYDYNGYGYGPNDDGLMLLVSMEERDWWVTTHGTAYEQLTESRLNKLMSDVLGYLSDGQYYKAFERFGYNSAALMQMDPPSGDVYRPGDSTSRQFVTLGGFLTWLLNSVITGAVVSGIITASRMSAHRTVRFSEGAKPYLQSAQTRINDAYGNSPPGARVDNPPAVAGLMLAGLASALMLRSQSETYVRESVSRTAISSSSSSFGDRDSSSRSSSGGFGGHESSSGRTHGGGGGKF